MPKHPQYSVDSVRLSSYSRWPIDFLNPVILTDAGFFYAGFGDCVRCFSCGGGLRNWEYGDTPWIEHAQWYPACEYLKQCKGDLFIEMYRHDRNDKENPSTEIPTPHMPPLAVQRQPTQVNAAKAEEVEEDISIKNVLEMGYSKSDVNFAIEQLRKRGKSKYTSVDLLEVIWDQEEIKTTTTISATAITTANTSAATSFPTQNAVSVSSSDTKSLKEENKLLKQMQVCKICMDKCVNVTFLPCGHLVIWIAVRIVQIVCRNVQFVEK